MANQATPRCPNCFAAGFDTHCTHCGWRPGQGNPPPALAVGVVLDGRYRIGRVLGHGGFGITYLAWDDNLHLRLAIKEYLPRDSATRAPDGTSLSVFSGAAEEQFAYGLDRFLEEARTLARFDQHPGIVTVKNYFRAHGTGYCVMEYVEGITLRQYLDQQPGGKLGVEAAWTLLMPVMDALRAVHKDGLLHRDIAPDNIYLTQDGRVKLLDFGAARFAAGEHSKSLSVILKPGYAPEEQYRARGKQGPWTDVYGLGATLYRAITGQVPPDSLDRLDQDELVPPSRLGVVIPPTQEAHLLKALAIKAEGRWQNMEQLQQGWRSGNAPLPQSVLQPTAEAPQPAVEELPPVTTNDSKSPSKSPLRWAMLGALLVLAFAGYFVWNKQSEPIPDANSTSITQEKMVDDGSTVRENSIPKETKNKDAQIEPACSIDIENYQNKFEECLTRNALSSGNNNIYAVGIMNFIISTMKDDERCMWFNEALSRQDIEKSARRKISNKYISLINSEIKQSNFNSAKNYLKSALDIDPSNDSLGEIAKVIENNIEQQKAKSSDRDNNSAPAAALKQNPSPTEKAKAYVIPGKFYTNADGLTCRNIERVAEKGGEVLKDVITACKTENGWVEYK